MRPFGERDRYALSSLQKTYLRVDPAVEGLGLGIGG
jgi:hypothetical protein